MLTNVIGPFMDSNLKIWPQKSFKINILNEVHTKKLKNPAWTSNT